MAYDRYDPRDERARWRGDRHPDRGPSEERGFFERAGDEVASWFGDEEADRRRREDQRMEERERSWEQGRDHGYRTDRGRFADRGDWDRNEGRYRSTTWTGREPERTYRPPSGNQFFAASGYARGGFGSGDFERERSFDPNYRSWRQRQLDELDRDYDDYRRENQARFEDDFGGWRQRRQQKRGLLGQIREHMEVVGSDNEHVGTIDRPAGDRIILTKSDPESGGVHHSLSCSDIAGIEGDRVVLDLTAEQAKLRWRDESRSRALFEREDRGEMGDRILDRSFEGTYR
jgi:hypothetical protein